MNVRSAIKNAKLDHVLESMNNHKYIEVSDHLISIIVPVYNASEYISQTIHTVAAQTWEDWELILVDDCSTDDSIRQIEQALRQLSEPFREKIRLIRSPRNQGASAARNMGLAAAKGRYISFLDADDLWDPHKLDLEMNYMRRNQAAFVFCSYKYGNSEGVPTGKIVRVPRTLTYKEALSRTVIFTSTVLIDTAHVSKDLIKMPDMPSEDTATWWTILRSGVTAYGLEMPLVIYRRPEKSLSSNKMVSIQRIWNLYMKIAKLPKPKAFFTMIAWAWRASVRRTVDDVVRSHFESLKQFTTLQMSLIGLLILTAMYAVTWFRFYYPILHSVRYSRTGINHGVGLTLYVRGHIFVILLYFLLLLFFSSANGSMKTGYSKPAQIFGSKVVSLLFANVITYAQISIIWNWIVDPRGMIVLSLAQVLVSLGWSYFSDFVYRKVFKAKETLVIMGDKAGQTGAGSGNHAAGRPGIMAGGSGLGAAQKISGAAPAASPDENARALLRSRSDRFNVIKVAYENEGPEKLKKECLRWYGCVVLYGLEDGLKKQLIRFCYQHRIRVYVIPDVDDLLMQGAEQMDLFDSAMLEIKEYSISWNYRVVKRIFDVILSGLAIIGCSPVMLYKAIRLKAKRQKVLRHVSCAGRNHKTIQVTYFNDNGFGYSLPRLFNVFCGTMSLIGPEPLDTLTMKVLCEENEDYRMRTRVKPGITGYSQIHGRRYVLCAGSAMPAASGRTHGRRDASAQQDMCGSLSDMDLEALKLDLYYMQHYSFLLDFKILITKQNGRSADRL